MIEFNWVNIIGPYWIKHWIELILLVQYWTGNWLENNKLKNWEFNWVNTFGSLLNWEFDWKNMLKNWELNWDVIGSILNLEMNWNWIGSCYMKRCEESIIELLLKHKKGKESIQEEEKWTFISAKHPWDHSTK